MGGLTTNHKVEANFCLLEFRMTKIVTWECHADESSEIRYDMVLGRDILTAFGLNFKTSIKVDDGTF